MVRSSFEALALSDRRSLDQNFRRGSHLSHNGLGPDVVEIHHPGGSNYQTDYNNQKYSPLRIRVRHQYPRPPSAEDSVVHQVPQTYTLHGGTAEITRYPHDDPYYRYQYLAPALVPHAYAANQEKLILTDIHQRPSQDYLNKEEGVAAKTIVEMPTSEKFLFIFLIFALTMSSILLAICLIACISNAVRVARAEEEDLPEFFPGGIDGPSAFPNGGRFGIHPPTNFNLSPQEAAKLEIQSMMMGKNGLPVSPAEAWSYATRPPIWQMEEEAEEEESEEEEEEV
ncbi:unnamed protein product [Cyprideis torosa]|uniref:Uncharacterized protein n=1 Tax=Cyprideis torosa TaxID=163714 RepID=A0A7R8WIY8_9CRUS|nr:unnamed protein product [Cyprideis torosa]CAG0894655.1 unnamed protein product [Cyprideis torosa]